MGPDGRSRPALQEAFRRISGATHRMPMGCAEDRLHRALRSAAVTRTPFLRPSALTTSSVAGTVMDFSGGTEIPESTLASEDSPSLPCTARPLRTSGDAFSIRIRYVGFPF